MANLRLYAVFGNPIAHSKSPLLHNYVFYKLGIDARYIRYHLETSDNFRDLFFNLNLSGANITLPFKESLIESCDEIRGIAKEINAINTIVMEDSKLIGYNTDATGFYQNIFKFNIKNALIIGAGGSAKAIAYILKENNIKVSIINRSEPNLKDFRIRGFECHLSSEFKYQDYQFDLVVNATSSSINNVLPLSTSMLESIFRDSKIAFDLMYGKECKFLELAKKYNLKVIDGSKMLLYQAIFASSLFLNINNEKISKAMSEIYNTD